MLPAASRSGLQRHLESMRRQHESDVRCGAGWVELPDALAKKYPNAGREWGWQWIFPATRLYTDRVTGQRRRHHLHESVLQLAVKHAVRSAGWQNTRAVTRCVTRSPRIFWKMVTVQELLGHRDVATTMIYTLVLNRVPSAVRSPADRLLGL